MEYRRGRITQEYRRCGRPAHDFNQARSADWRSSSTLYKYLVATEQLIAKNKIREHLCCAVWEHDASRALDPQLHTHCGVANVTFDQSGQRYALETLDMVRAIRYAGKVYQSALRREVTRCGYRTVETKSERGHIKRLAFSALRRGR